MVRDRFWAWGSWGQNDIKTFAASGDPDNTVLENTTVKLNAQITSANSAIASYNNGDKINSDRLVLLFAKHYRANNPGGKIVYDVKCSEILDPEIRAAGGERIMWMIGHALVKKKVLEVDSLVVGELGRHDF